jgi:uncharacterized protein YodC (DUF2158 family)
MKFNRGDVVCLKCGGQDMIVEEINQSRALCVWHDKAGRERQRWYDMDLLKPGGENEGLVHLTINTGRTIQSKPVVS